MMMPSFTVCRTASAAAARGHDPAVAAGDAKRPQRLVDGAGTTIPAGGIW
jgi:hypothetical protein